MSSSLATLHKSTGAIRSDRPEEKTAARIQFQLIYANQAQRGPGSGTGWRRLPGTLVEAPRGGYRELSLRGKARPLKIKPGFALVVPTGVEHRLVWRGGRLGTTHYLLGRFLWMNGLDVVRMARIPFVTPCSEGLLRSIRRMANLSGKMDQDIDAVVGLQIEAFRALRNVLPYGSVRHFQAPDRSVEKILPVLRLIQDHPRENHSVSDLADYLDLSPTRFHALFKQVIGQAPVYYLQSVRCAQACQDLVHTSLTAAEISERCGFTSPFYFSRLFRKVIGQSPVEFRRAFQGGAGFPLSKLSGRELAKNRSSHR